MNTRSYRRSLLGKCAFVGVLACSAALADAAAPPPPPIPPSYGSAIWFEPPRMYQAGDSGGSVAIADVTGDRRNDVVMAAGFDHREQRLFVFRQLPDGSLAGATSYRYTPPNYPGSADVAVGDLNEDGTADVAVASGRGVSLFHGRRGRLRGPSRLGTLIGTQQVLIRDINRDGRLDLLVVARNVDPAQTGVFLMRRTRAGLSMRRVHRFVLGEIELGDVNGDRRLDIVAFARPNDHYLNAPQVIAVCPQQRGGAFRCRYMDHQQPHGEGPNGLELADVTSDGRADVVITAGGNHPRARLIVFPQTARGQIGPPVRYSAMDIPFPVEAADVSGDGRMDLVVAHRAFPYLGAFVQTRERTLEGEALHPNVHGYYGPKGLAVGHVDGDRYPDVVLASNGSLYVHRHRTQGPGAAPLVAGARYARPFVAEAGRPFEVELVFSRRWHLVNARVRSTCSAAIAGTPLPRVAHRLRRDTVLCRWNVPPDARGKPLTAWVTVRAGNARVTGGYVETVR